MPRRRTHLIVGTLSGAGLAAHRSAGHPDWARLLETAGGGIGGAIGGRLPDILEPPFCPNHRGPAHSLSALALIAKVAHENLTAWQSTVRRWADDCATKRAACEAGSVLSVAWGMAEAVLRFLAGLIAGVIGGYVSHVALDAFTPAGMAII